MQLIAGDKVLTAAAAMIAGTEVDLLSGGTAGFDLQNGDTVLVSLKETAAIAVNTVKIYLAGSTANAQLLPLATTTSVSASGTRQILISGVSSGKIRVTGNSTSGSSAVTADISVYQSGSTPRTFAVALDGALQGAGTGGAITGNLSQSGGTATINATGAVSIDGSTSIAIGPTSATSVAVGCTAVAPSFPGGLTVATGKAVTGSGTLAVEATGALSVGVNASTTSIVVGQATVAPSFTGGISIASAKAVTGAGAMAVEATGALTVAGAAGTTSSLIGRVGNVTTMVGDVLLNNLLRGVVADAGAAGASGTANATFGTFTVASGQTGYVLTNSVIQTTSLIFCMCIAGAVARSVFSFIPTLHTGTLLLSGAAGADSKFAFLVVNV